MLALILCVLAPAVAQAHVGEKSESEHDRHNVTVSLTAIKIDKGGDTIIHEIAGWLLFFLPQSIRPSGETEAIIAYRMWLEGHEVVQGGFSYDDYPEDLILTTGEMKRLAKPFQLYAHGVCLPGTLAWDFYVVDGDRAIDPGMARREFIEGAKSSLMSLARSGGNPMQILVDRATALATDLLDRAADALGVSDSSALAVAKNRLEAAIQERGGETPSSPNATWGGVASVFVDTPLVSELLGTIYDYTLGLLVELASGLPDLDPDDELGRTPNPPQRVDLHADMAGGTAWQTAGWGAEHKEASIALQGDYGLQIFLDIRHSTTPNAQECGWQPPPTTTSSRPPWAPAQPQPQPQPQPQAQPAPPPPPAAEGPAPGAGPVLTRSPELSRCAELLGANTGREHRKEGRPRASVGLAFVRADLVVYINSTDPQITEEMKHCAELLLSFLDGNSTPSDKDWIVETYKTAYDKERGKGDTAKKVLRGIGIGIGIGIGAGRGGDDD